MKFLKIAFCVIISLLLIFTVGCASETDIQSGNTDLNSVKLKVHFIDVGQGDSAFIEFPSGETLLIDAGESEYGSVVSAYIKNLGYSAITYVIGTHPHSDHIGGLEEIIRGFDIGSVYMPKVSTNTKTFEGLLTAIGEKGLKINTARKDVLITDKENLQVKVLSPVQNEYSDINNYSVVLMITYYNNRFLFTGDAEVSVEAELTGDISCDVLKVGHHGSSTSSSVSFLKAAAPKYAVISCGKDNKYGHPHTEVMTRLSEIGASVLRTDISGNIVIESDGNVLTISKNTVVEAPKVPVGDNNENIAVRYILNTSSKKIHLPDCSSVKDIKEGNCAEAFEQIDELKAEGYTPCGKCKPE